MIGRHQRAVRTYCKATTVPPPPHIFWSGVDSQHFQAQKRTFRESFTVTKHSTSTIPKFSLLSKRQGSSEGYFGTLHSYPCADSPTGFNANISSTYWGQVQHVTAQPSTRKTIPIRWAISELPHPW